MTIETESTENDNRAPECAKPSEPLSAAERVLVDSLVKHGTRCLSQAAYSENYPVGKLREAKDSLLQRGLIEFVNAENSESEEYMSFQLKQKEHLGVRRLVHRLVLRSMGRG